jgi:hypothetical protein
LGCPETVINQASIYARRFILRTKLVLKYSCRTACQDEHFLIKQLPLLAFGRSRFARL